MIWPIVILSSVLTAGLDALVSRCWLIYGGCQCPVLLVVFSYQITVFYNKTQQRHFWNFILMTECKLCMRAAAPVAAVAVNKERSPIGPM